MGSSNTSKVRPLKVRTGVHYTCFGDGLCCTDLHGLGPLTKKEARALQLVSEDVVIPARESGFDEPMLRTRDDGGCLFLGKGRCDLHAALGADAKPDGCRRFPLGLTATPSGGRVTTRHRCSCRTLGDRPKLLPEAAEPSLLDGRGRLAADRHVTGDVALTRGRTVPFSEWERLEARLLGRLAKGDDPLDVLDAKPFPKLKGSSWSEEAEEMLEDGVDRTRFGNALAWFAQAVLALTGEGWKHMDALPWAHELDRAEARAATPGDPKQILADWVADEIWSMKWTEDDGTFSRARRDLATRYSAAKFIVKRLRRRGLRSDRAAAEAVAIADLMGDSEWWEDVVKKMRR